MLCTSTLCVSSIALDVLQKPEFWTGRTHCRLGNRKGIFQVQRKVLSDIWEAGSQRKFLEEAGGWKELCALTLIGWILFIFLLKGKRESLGSRRGSCKGTKEEMSNSLPESLSGHAPWDAGSWASKGKLLTIRKCLRPRHNQAPQD